MVQFVKSRSEKWSCQALDSLAETHGFSQSTSPSPGHSDIRAEGSNDGIINTPGSTTPRQEQMPTAQGDAKGGSHWEIPVPDTMAGDAYGLTIEDARAITVSDQVRGNIWLTYTYNAPSFSFITIPISQELSDQLASQRPRIL